MRFLRFDWEGIVMEDIVDDVQLVLVFVYGIMVSVKVDFLYMEVFTPVGVLWMEMSR
jgi:hypothetical protein